MHSPHPLENPVWHALTGPQATVAEGGPLAYRFRPDIAPFVAMPDEITSDSWEALRALVPSDGFAAVVRADLTVPDRWETLVRVPCVQMVLTTSPTIAALPSVDLNIMRMHDADVPEMRALVDLTRPGPFFDRTIELGRFIGMRDDAQLVAMGGERMRLDGIVELSAICTHPNYRGRGLATVIVADLIEHARASGATPVLHAVDTNVTAIKVYEQLGFEIARTLEVTGVRPA